MLGICTNRPDEVFLDGIKPFQLIDEFDPDSSQDYDGLFIEWVPKESGDAWLKQASLLQYYIKKIPIVVFDSRFTLIEKEVQYLQKNGAHLFEPALRTRLGFGYLPLWISHYSILENDDARSFDLLHVDGNLEYRVSEFDKWYMKYARLFPDKKVAYFSRDDVENFKVEEYKKSNLLNLDGPVLPDYSCSNFFILIGMSHQYKIGYFDPMHFIAMNLGCIPLLPFGHKYFQGMFKGLVVNNLNDVDYFVGSDSFRKIRKVVIEEIFDRIKSQYPEFTVEYAIDTVKKCYE